MFCCEATFYETSIFESKYISVTLVFGIFCTALVNMCFLLFVNFNIFYDLIFFQKCDFYRKPNFFT